MKRYEPVFNELGSKFVINGISFSIDENGIVSTTDCGILGHFEECQKFGEAMADLIEALIN